jgi:hypothetical protein
MLEVRLGVKDRPLPCEIREENLGRDHLNTPPCGLTIKLTGAPFLRVRWSKGLAARAHGPAGLTSITIHYESLRA